MCAPGCSCFAPVTVPAWTYNGHLEDVDFVTHYRTLESGILCGHTEATLNAALLDGRAIERTDQIRTVGCSPPE